MLDRSYTPPLGLLEIKCPFTYKDLTPSEASLNQDFYCEMVDNKIRLKHSHKYYAQVQGQLALSGLTWCDFVVYTHAGLNIERINFNQTYWEEKLFPKITVLSKPWSKIFDK